MLLLKTDAWRSLPLKPGLWKKPSIWKCLRRSRSSVAQRQLPVGRSFKSSLIHFQDLNRPSDISDLPGALAMAVLELQGSWPRQAPKSPLSRLPLYSRWSRSQTPLPSLPRSKPTEVWAPGRFDGYLLVLWMVPLILKIGWCTDF